MAALGMETPDGEFEVVDVCFAGMAPHMQMDPMMMKHDGMNIDGDQISRTQSTLFAEIRHSISRRNLRTKSHSSFGLLDCVAVRSRALYLTTHIVRNRTASTTPHRASFSRVRWAYRPGTELADLACDHRRQLHDGQRRLSKSSTSNTDERVILGLMKPWTASTYNI